MRRILVAVMLLLIGSSAQAAVRIIAEHEDWYVVAIKYETDGEKVRAFALDITLDTDDEAILRIFDYHKGPSTAASPGYGIFPGNFAQHITVDPDTGEVTTWDVNEYTPLCDPCYPGALGGLDTNGVTIELGALYYPTGDDSPNAPGNSGLLCRLGMAYDDGAEPFCFCPDYGPRYPPSFRVAVIPNAARRGIVLTCPDKPVDFEFIENRPDWKPVPGQHPDWREWVAVGKPECWAYKRQCLGDADGRAQGSAKTGFHYVGTNDLNILIRAWQIKEPPKGPGIATIPDGICADFARDQQGSAKTGFMRVGTNDLNILIAGWMVKEPPHGPGLVLPPEGCGGDLEPGGDQMMAAGVTFFGCH